MIDRFLKLALLLSLLLVPLVVAQAADNPPRIMADAVKARLDAGEQVVFIDTRNGYDWSGSNKMIPGAMRIRSQQEFDAAVKLLPVDSFIVTYCT